MQTTGTLKVGTAFLAGVVVALGSAFFYFHASAKHGPAPVQVVAIETPEKQVEPLPEPVQEQSTPRTTPSVADVPAPLKTRTHAIRPKPRISTRPVSLEVPDAKSTPAQEPIAQQTMPEPPVDLPPPPAPAVQAPQPHTVTIPAGTSLVVRLGEKLSTEHNYTGDTFRAALEAPIVMNGFIIADRGAKVLGRIVKAQKPGKMEGLAELSLALTEVSTTDGQQVEVETNESLRKGPSNTNEEVIKMAGGAALGAIIGALAGGGKGAVIGAGAGGAAGTGAVLLGRGRPAVIENETRLTFELANSITITEHLN